jgi:hypothetical protein
MNTISIALFSRHSEADSYQARLTDAGIPSEIHDCASMKGARLEVPADRFEQAYTLLQKWDATEGGIRGAIRCPECHSLRVEYPQYTHKSALPNVLVGVLANIGAMRKEFYCYDCHFTWPKEGTKPSRARPHMAPYYFIEGVPQRQPREPEPRHAT